MGVVEPWVIDFLEQIRRENNALQEQETKRLPLREQAERGEEVRKRHTEEDDEEEDEEENTVIQWEM